MLLDSDCPRQKCKSTFFLTVWAFPLIIGFSKTVEIALRVHFLKCTVYLNASLTPPMFVAQREQLDPSSESPPMWSGKNKGGLWTPEGADFYIDQLIQLDFARNYPTAGLRTQRTQRQPFPGSWVGTSSPARNNNRSKGFPPDRIQLRFRIRGILSRHRTPK